MLSVKQLAERLNLSVSKIYEMTANGKINHYRIGGSIRYSEAQIEEYLEKHEKRERETIPAKKKHSRPRLQNPY